jgi:hypothetical protein
VFGVAALASGLITLVWHDYDDGHLLRYIVYAAAAALIFGGAAIQFRRSAKAGAAVLDAAYLVIVLRCVPGIVAAPQIDNSWGNFFEKFSFGGSGARLCAFVISMAGESAYSGRAHSLGHLYRFLYTRTGVLS